MTNEIKAVQVDAETIEKQYGISKASLAILVERAREAVTIDATLRAHYLESRDDGIVLPTHLDGVVDHFIYVLSEYRCKLATLDAALDLVKMNITTRDAMIEELTKERDEQSSIRATLQLKYDNEVDDLNVACDNANRARDEALEARDEAQAKGNEAWTELEGSKEREKIAAEELERRIRINEAREISLTEQTNESTRLATELDALKSQIDQATDDDPSSSDALALMTAARDQLADEVTDLRTEIASLEDDVAVLKKTEHVLDAANYSFGGAVGLDIRDANDTPVMGLTDGERLSIAAKKLARLHILVTAVGRVLTKCPPSVRSAHKTAISH